MCTVLPISLHNDRCLFADGFVTSSITKNSRDNRHEIWVRIRKRIKFEVKKISLESVKFHQEINDDVQTWFEKLYAYDI